MRRRLAASVLILASVMLAAHGPARAQSAQGSTAPADPMATNPNIAATGRMMPPMSGRAPPSGKTSTGLPPSALEAEMIKAQKAAEARNKAWDARMRKTMGSICSGC